MKTRFLSLGLLLLLLALPLAACGEIPTPGGAYPPPQTLAAGASPARGGNPGACGLDNAGVRGSSDVCKLLCSHVKPIGTGRRGSAGPARDD
jgi:predicted small lipoprotein YifL